MQFFYCLKFLLREKETEGESTPQEYRKLPLLFSTSLSQVSSIEFDIITIFNKAITLHEDNNN